MNVYTEKQSNFWGAVQNSGGGVKGVFCEKQFFRILLVCQNNYLSLTCGRR